MKSIPLIPGKDNTLCTAPVQRSVLNTLQKPTIVEHSFSKHTYYEFMTTLKSVLLFLMTGYSIADCVYVGVLMHTYVL